MVKCIRATVIGAALLCLPLAGCEELPLGPDTEAPTITLVSPPSGATATDTLVAVVNATDDRGVTAIEILIDGTAASRAEYPASTLSLTDTLVVSLVDAGAGEHVLSATAYDSAGNTATTDSVDFTAVVEPGLKFISRLLVDGSARDVVAAGDYAYVAAWDGGVIVVDVSNPLVPLWTARYDTRGVTNGVEIAGDRLFVADGEEGLIVLSVADPEAPEELLHFKPTGINAQDVAVNATHAFVAGGAGGLFAVDITDPDTLVGVGVYSSSGGEVVDVELSGNLAFTAEINQGMRVIDISKPDSMSALDQYTGTGVRIMDISLNGSYAYAAAGNDGLVAVNVSNPDSIWIADFYSMSDQAEGVVATGVRTFVAAGSAGVQAINSTNPADLRPLTGGVFDTDGICYKMDYYLGYLLVADNAQLTILKYVSE